MLAGKLRLRMVEGGIPPGLRVGVCTPRRRRIHIRAQNKLKRHQSKSVIGRGSARSLLLRRLPRCQASTRIHAYSSYQQHVGALTTLIQQQHGSWFEKVVAASQARNFKSFAGPSLLAALSVVGHFTYIKLTRQISWYWYNLCGPRSV